MCVPAIADRLPKVWRFIEELSAGVTVGTVASSSDLITRCREFYTPERQAEIETVVPGWTEMSSHLAGKALWHVNVAMVALVRIDEYRAAPPADQRVLEWITLVHDVAKSPTVSRDHRHAFRSAAAAGMILPRNGFPVTAAYQREFYDWYDLTSNALIGDPDSDEAIQDNSKLALIAGGAKRIFDEPTRAAVMSIALHQSITSLEAWPVAAQLTTDQTRLYVDDGVRPYLRALMLADSGGWNLFHPAELRSMYAETRSVFDALDLPGT